VKITPNELDVMCQTAGITKDALYTALRTMGPKVIKPAFRSGWSDSNPVFCTCYFVSEFAYFYLAPKGTIPYSVKVPGDPGLHRFLKYPTGAIIDLTAEQFPDYDLVKSLYPVAKVTYFMQTGCTGPSKRAQQLATLLGVPTSWSDPKIQ